MNCQRGIGADLLAYPLTGNRHQDVTAAPMMRSILTIGFHTLLRVADPSVGLIYIDPCQIAVFIPGTLVRPFRYGFKIDMGVVTGVSLYIYVIGDHQIVLDGRQNLTLLQPSHVGVGQPVVEAVFQNRSAAVPLTSKSTGIIGNILIVFHHAGTGGFRCGAPVIVPCISRFVIRPDCPFRPGRGSVSLGDLLRVRVPDDQIARFLRRLGTVVTVRVIQGQQRKIIDRSIRFLGQAEFCIVLASGFPVVGKPLNVVNTGNGL